MMFSKVRIGTKIMLLLLSVVIATIFSISYLAYIQSRDSVEDKFSESLGVLVNLKAKQLEEFFVKKENALFLVQKTLPWQEIIPAVQRGEENANVALLNQLVGELSATAGIEAFYVTDSRGTVLHKYGYSSANMGETLPYFEIFAEENKTILSDGITFSAPFFSQDQVTMYTALGMQAAGQDFYLIAQTNIGTTILPLVQDSTNLGETGEIMIGRLNGIRVEVISSLRFGNYQPLSYTLLLEDNTSVALQKAVSGEPSDFLQDTDYRGQATLSYWQTIPHVQWGIVAKTDLAEIHHSVDNLLWTFFKSGGIILLFSILVATIFSKFLTNPIRLVKSRLSLVSQGILPEKIDLQTNDEIGEMAQAVNELISYLKSTAQFARQIGEGKYQTDFQPITENDILGNALVSMKQSIELSEIKDNERNWIVSGVAEIGQLLRLHNNLSELGDDIVGFISKKIGSVQGAFYTLNDDTPEEVVFEMKASFAYNKKKYLHNKFKFAQGLVGQCAAEQDVILRTEIPYDYVTVTSGILGDKRPTCLLLVPLITNETVYGVMEFAGFERFNETQISFVKEISVIVARTIFNIKVNERTVHLLEESQKMSEELQFQQEILRQNAEEMEATQEELRRTNHRLEDQILEVNRTQKRLQVLLENASEVITIYEKNGKIRYISPSVEPILGYMAEELIGQSDISHMDSENAMIFQNLFNELLTSTEQRLTVQYEYKRRNGQSIWLEATGTNLLHDPAIKGIVINSRDITERRRAEKEERMRSQMQALSENSPDLIMRLNNEGVFFYINPAIKILTGFQPHYFLGKALDEVVLNQSVKDNWKQAFSEVLRKRDKFSLEMEFPDLNGEVRIMQLNAIPELGEDDLLESVLLVSHDITEQKNTELEIRSSNKKITESINYAKRIQTAILPDDHIIRDAFPDSFILYKPRDVVSGDFPWYMQNGDDIYIAAVDCTGHGVPGALISLIGYFILNDVANSETGLSTGKLLDMLNDGVTKTLRQDDANTTTRDGMDIAILRVNFEQGFIEFSGANRILLRYSNGELEQIKGNSFPIGGGQYRNRTMFTTYRYDLVKGDEYFMFSDGFPDQFGGEHNKKFSNQRIREIINSRNFTNMREAKQVFLHEFEEWMGNKKQTDDVLMMGIRF